MRTFYEITLNIVGLIAMYGLVIPTLVSQPNTFVLILGIALAIAYPPLAYKITNKLSVEPEKHKTKY